MKYALVLASTLTKQDWHCYAIADSLNDLQQLNCYDTKVVKLPKSQFPGEIDETPVYVQSCQTGNNSEFRVVEISDINLTGTFNLS